MLSLGILSALAALVCWGIGDFLIQRTARLNGSIEALFTIGVVSMVGIFPFIYLEFAKLTLAQVSLLALTGFIIIVSSLFNFEALRKGKIAVIEPIVGLELPIVVILSIVFVGEHPSVVALLLIVLIFVGTMCIIVKDLPTKKIHRLLLERGVFLAFVATLGTALSSVFIGISSHATSALMAIWFGHTMLAVATGIAIATKHGFGKLAHDIRTSPWTVAGESIFDTVAWIAFAFATTQIPISIATGVSGGYVALAVLLGIFVSRERLSVHQGVGIIAVAGGVIALSLFG